MNFRRILPASALIGAAMLSACVKADASSPYTVTVPLSENENQLMAYIVDFDSGEKIDSTVIDHSKAVFKGKLDKPVLARVTFGSSRIGTFVLEPGDITLHADTRIATGAPLNVRFNTIADSLQAIEKAYAALPRDSAFEASARRLSDDYNDVISRAVASNTDNPIGLYYFLQQAYTFKTPAELSEALAKCPAFMESRRVKALSASLTAKHETSPGHKFKDFSISYAGTDSVARLSDYVGRGKWVLVDFWASWCGPCIRETKVLKEILAEYGQKGLEVLGVAVWDEPENTRQAIRQHQLPWPQIIGAQTVPTDLYGISGIPCIILISPDGMIVARDLQDEELKAAVRKALDDDASEPQR